MSTTELPDRTRSNNAGGSPPLQRAEEVEKLINSVQSLILPFITAADNDAATISSGHGLQIPGGGPRSVLVEHHKPPKLRQLLDLPFPPLSPAAQDSTTGLAALHAATERILQHSVNTWSQGFLDKLYAAPSPPGLAAELVLAALNTNVHVFGVAPALTVIEKDVSRALAGMFGLKGARAGAVSQPGGSAANAMSLCVARAVKFPESREEGLSGKKLVLFTSGHGHYSVEKAALNAGLGLKAVRKVKVDAEGRMRVDDLERLVGESKKKGETPFYVNATAGSTVLGSYDPLDEIAKVCRKHDLWLHVDGSWGGSVVFSEKQRHKLAGIDRADSITLCAHKMLNVPLTCSFLIGRDIKEFHQAMTLPAEYLYHDDPDADESSGGSGEFWDLGELVPQCGRRGDSLKLAFSWIYYGTKGLGAYVDQAFDVAAHLTSLVKSNSRFSLVTQDPSPCLQVCFFVDKQDKQQNDKTTEQVVKALAPRGFMTDYAPGEDGKFFRVVVNGSTRKETVKGLIKAIEDVADQVHQ